MPSPGRTTVASVPYVNALPLVKALEQEGSPLKVVFDVPSRLPALLDSGEVAAILVSSYEGLRQPGMRMAAGVCIGSEGPVDSVRLFSKKPFPEIRTLALDQSSMTSNRLAQVLLRAHGAKPETLTLPPDQDAMLDQADACILIGDIGMTASGVGLHVMDLGAEWTRQTSLPFIWAAWMGREPLTSELAQHLNQALLWSGCGRGTDPTAATDSIIDEASAKPGWTEAMARTYLTQTMVYKAGPRELDGLREFQTRLQDAGFDEARHFPQLIPAS